MGLTVLCFLVQYVPQHAIELILVSQNARLESDSNDSRIMCILCKTKKLLIHVACAYTDIHLHVSQKRMETTTNDIRMLAG